MTIVAKNSLTLTNLNEKAIDRTEISFWHGLSATKRPLGVYDCVNRDHQYGNEFNVTSGETYTVRVIAKQTKGSIRLAGGIWYTAMTSGHAYDTYGPLTLVGEASEDGIGVYERKLVVASGKTKAKIFIQIEQGYSDGSTAWRIYDGQVFDENGQPLVTDQNNYGALASPMATPNGTYIWKRTITYYTDGTSNTIWEYSGVGKDGAKGDKGDQGVQGIQGLQGPTGTQGVAGPKGADGKTQYTHIAYANSADGTANFSTSDSNRTYIGMYVDFNVDDSNTPSNYSWTLVKGADGTQGTPGKAGADGKTPYFHTAWSHSADGTDRFTTVYPNLNLFTGTSDKPSTKTGNSWNIADIGVYKTPKVGQQYTVSVEVPNADHDVWMEVYRWNAAGARVDKLISTYIKSGAKGYLTFTWPDPGNSGVTQFAANLAWTNGGDTGSYSYCKAKLEPGSTVTPYMGSSSEVTTADWPSYIGQYTDFTQDDSTNPSDYTWSLIRGNDGKDGADGKDGIAGKDGVGIKTTVITYAISTSGTTAPTSGWTTQVPTLIKGQYLWTKTVWTYTDNSSETGYSVTYISKDGNNGTNGVAGKDGVGIKTTTITYVGSTSGTTVPTSGWTSTIPTVAAGSYLWTKTVWTYSDNTSETGYSVAKMGNTGATGPAGPPGSTGAPGKIVSNTEPTTKFKGLTWKYIGANDITASDGTNILAGTEYYWNGTVWALYEINAHNINGDNLSVTNGTFKDGKIESIWGSNEVNGTTTIENNHLLIHSTNSVHNTENTVALDNQQGYAQLYVDKKTGRIITVQASIQGFFVSDSTGPFVRVTPNGITTSSDKTRGSIQIGAGITLSLERRGNIVECVVIGTINSALESNVNFNVGVVPIGYRPNKIVNIIVHMTSTNNSSHIDVGTNGVCTWWGASTNRGYPRGTQLWFTDDPIPQ